MINSLGIDQLNVLEHLKSEIIRKIFKGIPLNIEHATASINWMYDKIDKKNPEIIISSNPIKTQLLSAQHWDENKNGLITEEIDLFFEQIFTHTMHNSFKDQFDTDLLDQLNYDQDLDLTDILDNLMYWHVIMNYVNAEKKQYFDPSEFAGVYGHDMILPYLFMDLLNIDLNEDFRMYKNLLESGVRDIITLENTAIITPYPHKIAYNPETHEIHSDTSPAMLWNDGFGLWFNNSECLDKISEPNLN